LVHIASDIMVKIGQCVGIVKLELWENPNPELKWN